ncbi:hypothetical protein L1987_71094 [Smallanthus sonchifolius]|uniref:Uncharacterized protein n=1 Tax=Smallanthus sonchifolius TaxID=185202 RepID=A0ACB9ARF7_9ASTR|nr:hypothetical protein L1987_71094 [Smallanthus sonchifolius]
MQSLTLTNVWRFLVPTMIEAIQEHGDGGEVTVIFVPSESSRLGYESNPVKAYSTSGDDKGSHGTWNEMHLIVFLSNVFVWSRSPVLQQPVVQYEVRNLARVLACVFKSDCPQYFRYFCTTEEELLLERNNFRLLGKDLMNRKFRNKSISNFAGTSEDVDQGTFGFLQTEDGLIQGRHMEFWLNLCLIASIMTFVLLCKKEKKNMFEVQKLKISRMHFSPLFNNSLIYSWDARYLMNVSLSHEMRCFCEIICKSVSSKTLPVVVHLDGALSRQGKKGYRFVDSSISNTKKIMFEFWRSTMDGIMGRKTYSAACLMR